MKRKSIFLVVISFVALLVVSCNNSTSDKKSEDTSENEEKEEIKYLEDFTRFEDSEQVAEYFGEENIINDVWSVAEGTETYLVTIVNPDSKNKIIIYWDKKSEDYKDYAFVEAIYSNFNSEWEEAEDEGFTFPSKSGIKIGTTLQELEKINGKAITFFGFGWDYGGMVTSTGDKLQGLAITVGCPEEENSDSWSDAYMNLLGDQEFSSSDDVVKNVPIVVTSISYHGK